MSKQPQHRGSELDRLIAETQRSLEETDHRLDDYARALANAHRTSLHATVFGVVGLLVGLILTVLAVQGLSDWPKWLRLVLVIAGTGATGWVFNRLANLLLALVSLAFLGAILSVVGIVVWTLV